MSQNPRYSVAIRTLGKSGDLFKKLIISLKSQTVTPEEIFVYIAEGYELPERVADEKYIYCKKGMVHQRALPFDDISTDYILFCDDDIEFMEDSVMKLFEALDEHKADCVSPNLFPNHLMSPKDKIVHAVLYGELPSLLRNNFAFRIRYSGYYTYSSRPKEVMLSQSCAGPCILINRSVFLQLRFWEETWMDSFKYPLGEDQMLAYKLYRTGHDLLIHFNSGVTHHDAKSSHMKDPMTADFNEKCLHYIIWYRSIYQPSRRFERIRAILCFYSRWAFQLLLAISGFMNGHSFRFLNCISSLKESRRFIKTEEFAAIPKWRISR